jgi:hypothetical protein
MRDWLPDNDIVHLILDAVALMDLSAFETAHKLGGAGQAPFAPSLLLSVLIYAYSYGVRSSRAIERLCGRDAGYHFIRCSSTWVWMATAGRTPNYASARSNSAVPVKPRRSIALCQPR